MRLRAPAAWAAVAAFLWLLPPAQEGDVMLIANAGAYGQVMSSLYNLRERVPEIVI